MNILAFDLANFSSSIALIKGGEIVFSEHNEAFRGQDITLLPKLQKLLTEHNLTFQDLDRLVTTRGPGSFTGIRVALATAQGLSFAADRPALGIDSFSWVMKTYLKEVNPAQSVLVLLASLRLELYGQLFTKEGEAVGTAFSLSPEDIAKTPAFKGALCLGNGAHHMKAHDFKIDSFMPQGIQLAKLALDIPEIDFEQYPCLPLYVREADTTKAKTLSK
tara:strand:- start:72 stop:728 length:657 start_codon:yes stop_codon:yes gene_type:complete